MMFAQYCRIESRLGGIGSSDRAFVKQAHKMLKKKARRDPALRDARHAWLRSGLEHKHQAEFEYRAIYPNR